MIKFHKMPRIDDYPNEGRLDNFQVTEKIDGSNFRFWFTNLPYSKEITVGTRNKGEDELDWNTFGKFKEYIQNRINETNAPLPKSLNKMIFFGEVNTLTRIKYKDMPPFLGFAVYDTETNKYVEIWEEYFKILNLVRVPIIKKKLSVADVVEMSKEGMRSYYAEDDCEGFILSDFKNQVFYKSVSPKFKETNRVPKSKTKGSSSIMNFTEKYITDNRLDKIIAKMQTSELDFNPKNPMPSAIGHLMKDVIEEANTRDLIALLRPTLLAFVSAKVRTRLKEIMELKKE